MKAPRLVTRALVASFLTVALVLGAVFAVLSLRVRDQVRQSVADNLASAQQVFTRVEARRQQDMRASVATLAENPTLKAALDTWLTERGTANEATSSELLATVQREARQDCRSRSAPTCWRLPTAHARGRGGGRLAASWPRGVVIGNADRRRVRRRDRAVSVGSGMYHVVSVPLQLGEATIGSLELGTALDDALRARAGRSVARRRGDPVEGRGPGQHAERSGGARSRGLPRVECGARTTMTLAGESWAVQPLSQLGDVTFLALASIDRGGRGQTQAALAAWLGRPRRDRPRRARQHLAGADADAADRSAVAVAVGDDDRRSRPRAGAAVGTSRELDQLTTTFNSLLASLAVGGGRSGSDLSRRRARAGGRARRARSVHRRPFGARQHFAVAIGEELKLDADAKETLRLGALLHDIGKIGVPDEVLRKSGALTAAEFETIKTHPSAGARILRSIPFLAPHIPIVELHHERPDGLGYPYGLRGDEIPLAARIVHVADAFDAMTSARAYRSGRIPVEAIAELRRCVGTDFDGPSVEALIAALPRLVAASEPHRSDGVPMGAARALRLAARRPSARCSSPSAASCVRRRRRASRSTRSRRPTSIADRRSRAIRPAWFDLFGAVRIADDLDLRARPVVFRRAFDGAWQTQIYELALRYERPGTIGLRIDAGQFTSPIGLSMLENRPDKNPVVSQHSTLYLPIPRYEAGTPSTNLLAAAYPLGAKVTVSGAKWDARAAVIDSSPVRGRPFFGDNKPPRMANVVAGVGFTPYIGLRFGAAFARRRLRRRERSARPDARRSARDAGAGRRRVGVSLHAHRRRVPVDATRAGRRAIRRVDGGWIEITQTVHPRVFLAARYDDQWTEWTSVPDSADRHEPYRRFEATARIPADAGIDPARQLHDAQGLRRRLLGRSVPGVDRRSRRRIQLVNTPSSR